MKQAAIISTGSFLPSRVLSNFDLEKMVETSDEWIFTRTGIRERRIADEDMAASDMGAAAGRLALERAGVSPEQVNLIIAATVTPDRPLPSTACYIQPKLGAMNAACFDLSAACSGFVYGVSTARDYLATHPDDTALVIGTEVLSKFTDYTDRTSCILFGDGAGAVVMQATEDGRGVLATHLGADGRSTEMMRTPAGGSRMPASAESVKERLHYIQIRGREVFKFAVVKMVEEVQVALDACGLSVDDVAAIVPHQVNTRILSAAAERLGIDLGKIYMNIERYANTSAASVPIALDEAVQTGKIQSGDVVVLVAFGGGLTWSSAVVRW